MASRKGAGPGAEPVAEPAGQPPAGPPTDAVLKAVMRALGRPSDFLRATVRAVGGDTYRVNVMTGPDASAVRIAHSYFVTADGNGGIVGSTPAITRQYPD